MMKAWRNVAQLQSDPLQDWRAKKGNGGAIVYGKDKVEALITRWHPFDNLYVAPPGSNQFAPAISLEQTCAAAYGSYIKRCRLSILILALAATFLAVVGVVKGKPRALQFALAIAGLVVFMATDYRLSAASVAALAERSSFYLFIRERGRMDAVLWTGVMATAGLIQLWLQESVGDFEVVVRKYGVLYQALSDGEWWRLLTGPFVHVGGLHWAVNLASLLLISGFGGVISRRCTIFVFLISSATGASAGWLLAGYTHQEAYAGVSGGIFGIFGMCTAVAFCIPGEFPKKMSLMIAGFSALNIFVSRAVSPDSSVEGHITGFAMGFLFGVLIALRRRSLRRRIIHRV